MGSSPEVWFNRFDGGSIAQQMALIRGYISIPFLLVVRVTNQVFIVVLCVLFGFELGISMETPESTVKKMLRDKADERVRRTNEDVTSNTQGNQEGQRTHGTYSGIRSRVGFD